MCRFVFSMVRQKFHQALDLKKLLLKKLISIIGFKIGKKKYLKIHGSSKKKICHFLRYYQLKISYLLHELLIYYKLSFKPLQFRHKSLSCIFLIDYIITQQSIHGVVLFLSGSISVFSVKLSNTMKTNLCVKTFKRH